MDKRKAAKELIDLEEALEKERSRRTEVRKKQKIDKEAREFVRKITKPNAFEKAEDKATRTAAAIALVPAILAHVARGDLFLTIALWIAASGVVYYAIKPKKGR